ncbi:MAG: hypothetical protein HYR89_10150, partial [Actinobacteria bacterium]|nr:hypothetical protein [Actinomycetota bacterium]
MSDVISPASSFGPNAWLVDEMYEQYLLDAGSVSEAWREFFADYRKGVAPTVTPAPKPEAPTISPEAAPIPAAPVNGSLVPAAPAPQASPAMTAPPNKAAEPIRGVGARIVTNMEASLGVP